jgi:hypothetical protein
VNFWVVAAFSSRVFNVSEELITSICRVKTADVSDYALHKLPRELPLATNHKTSSSL